jgi:hypothetical protein
LLVVYFDRYLIYEELHGEQLDSIKRRFTNRCVPHRSVFVVADRRSRETGQVGLKINTANTRLIDDDAVDRDEAILDIANADPTLSNQHSTN